MVEIWVPYGPVEVSFDIRQENLSQIIEPQTKKLSKEEIEAKVLETAGCDSILLLTATGGTLEILDSLLSNNKNIKKILYPKHLATLAKHKSQEFEIPVSEELIISELSEIGSVDNTQGSIFTQLKNSSNLLVVTSLHYDPMFGLTSAASDIVSLNQSMKSEAFKRSIDDLPTSSSNSNANWYATRLIQNCPNVSALEVIEKTGVGSVGVFSGEPEATHAKAIDFWKSTLSASIPTRVERILFGCGGGQNDISLTHALARSFFNVVNNASMKDSEAKICMLAECSQGLGSEAFFRYVTGRFTPGANLDQLSYFDGLEVLLSFYKIQGQLDLALISTLPKYYGEKFQFKVYSGAREAPSAVVSPGSRAKISVVPDASSISFKVGTNEVI